MLDIRRIDDRFAVAPQIAVEDVAAIKAAGFVAIISNRPDGEEPGPARG
ncbi:beta-lactamase hydrolase domain-containing protein [Sphingomonas sp. MMS24-JH45]